jgi:thymidylate synthase (FAD)
MQVIRSFFSIETFIDYPQLLLSIEKAGHAACKSEYKITSGSAEPFVRDVIKRRHLWVIEHASITVRVVCSWAVSNEIVRHTLASYIEEKARFCSYANDRFDNEIIVIKPCCWKNSDKQFKIWYNAMVAAERAYFELLNAGALAQEASSVLPNSLKTEIVMTMNLCEWFYFFESQTALSEHPQIGEIVIPMLKEFKRQMPAIFEDITLEQTFDFESYSD